MDKFWMGFSEWVLLPVLAIIFLLASFVLVYLLVQICLQIIKIISGQ